MKILFLLKTGQGAKWAFKMMHDLKQNYPDLTFSVVLPDDGPYFEEYKLICRNVYNLDFSLNINIFNKGKVLKRIVVSDKPDIIHSWFTQTTFYARIFLRKVKIPKIFQVVGPAHLETFIFKYGDILSAGRNDYWIATSRYIYDKYKLSGIKKSRLFLNYAYVDLQDLAKPNESINKRNFREEFGIKNSNKIIGTASFIYPPKFYQNKGFKGHEFLLKAFSNLLKERDDVVLIISGMTFGKNKSYENRLKKIAKKISKDKIFFTGGYKDIKEIIFNFDLFIYLSKSENLGGVYESLFFKIPTISSNKGGLPELIINDITGFNLDPKRTVFLVDKINNILNHNFDLTEAGKDLVMKKFDNNKIAEKALNIYKKLAYKEYN
jgi:glycosyltransferase involved in cell wall biosynthesis